MDGTKVVSAVNWEQLEEILINGGWCNETSTMLRRCWVQVSIKKVAATRVLARYSLPNACYTLVYGTRLRVQIPPPRHILLPLFFSRAD